MNANHVVGYLRLMWGLLLAAVPTQGVTIVNAEQTVEIQPYVRFLLKWPEQGIDGGFPPIVVTATDVLKGQQGVSVTKDSYSNVSLLGNCHPTASFPLAVHYAGPAGGVDLTAGVAVTMQTRPPQPASMIGFSLRNGIWSTAIPFSPSLTYVGAIRARVTRIWTTAGTYTGAVPITITAQ